MYLSPRIDAQPLLTRMIGEVVTRDDAGYDAARGAWNLSADQRPAAVAIPRCTQDIVEIVQFARERGLRVAPQGTGHNATPMASLEGTILVKTHQMRRTRIDAHRQIARVEAGAQWQDVTHEASELGLAALAGSAADVGIVGYSLGGGIGWLARAHGMATNAVTAIELVTTEGERVRTTRDSEPELFWALRGGGGNFGIVTAMEFKLFATPQLYAGAMLWPAERADEVLTRWREWTLDAPREATTSARILNLPPLPEIPEPLRGRSWVVLDGAVIGDEEFARKVLAPLRELGPELDMFTVAPPVALSYLHMDPPDPVPGISTHAMLDVAPQAAIDAMVATAGPGSDSPLMLVELRHLGGELDVARPGNGAMATMSGGYAMFAAGMAIPEILEPTVAALGGVDEAFAPLANGRLYGNFAEDDVDAAAFYGDDAYRRLQAVRRQVDPDGLMQANHEIPAA